MGARRIKIGQYCLPYVDVPGRVRFVTLRANGPTDIDAALINCLRATCPHAEYDVALAIVRGDVRESEMREPHARALLRLLQIVDAQRLDGLEHWEKVGAVMLCRLKVEQRALWYYIACDRLGYDPAESDVQPQRL